MNTVQPADEVPELVTIIQRSTRCLLFGLMALVPFLGLAFGPLAMVDYVFTHPDRPEVGWNPTSGRRRVGFFVAWIGFLCSMMWFTLLMGELTRSEPSQLLAIIAFVFSFSVIVTTAWLTARILPSNARLRFGRNAPTTVSALLLWCFLLTLSADGFSWIAIVPTVVITIIYLVAVAAYFLLIMSDRIRAECHRKPILIPGVIGGAILLGLVGHWFSQIVDVWKIGTVRVNWMLFMMFSLMSCVCIALMIPLLLDRERRFAFPKSAPEKLLWLLTATGVGSVLLITLLGWVEFITF